jgi:hypothetical protein
MNTISFFYSGVRWLWRYGSRLAIFSMCLMIFVPRSAPLPVDRWRGIALLTMDEQFNYLAWEADAIQRKAYQRVFGQQAHMSATQQAQVVRDYFDRLQTVQGIEAQIASAYADPDIDQPATTTADWQAQRDRLQQTLDRQQLMVEAILEAQVATVLVEAGFGYGGQLFPPMAMHFTQLPNLLVVSPRDEIQRRIDTLTLIAMPIDEITALESTIDQRYDVASLVIPLGGIALYPAMIYETASLPHAIETFAHEWLHHYLFFYPLGISYFTGTGDEAIIINETTADYFGKEIARQVIARYYPDLPAPPLPTRQTTTPTTPTDPTAFDFSAFMRETRITVDEMLANGEIATAEAYMETRRQALYARGYRIRKINQAFFAFYGSYQAGGGIVGAGGADPTGNAVIRIRQQSPSLYDFVVTMRDVSSREQLLALAELEIRN